MENARKGLSSAETDGPVRLKTIAQRLNLSSATVSRVLSGAAAAKSIPSATQKRIHDTALAMGYRPNVLARSLRSRRSYTVGVMVPEVSEGYATAVLSGIEQKLMASDFFYFVVSHHHRPELIEKYQLLLQDRAVDGLIAIDTPLARRLSVPTVTVSGHHEPAGVTNILLNHKRAATLAIEHLSRLHHRHLAFIQGQAFSSDTRARWKSIRAAMLAAKLTIRPAFVAQLEGEDPTHEPGYRATLELLKARVETSVSRRFTALFAFNDVSAIGAIRALREAGLRVPEDVSVVGFDDVQSAAFKNPGLTTVRQPLQQMGSLAAETLLQQISEPPLTEAQLSKHINRLVEPELIVRGSTSARKTAH